jgi:hypothetical protein
MEDGFMKKRGISILIEAVVVALMVIAAFSVAYYYITPSNPRLQRSQPDLNKLGFNILNSLAQSHAFDDTIINSTALFNYYNNCSHSPPSIVITPPTQWGNAASQLAYTVTVINNDFECGTETFVLQAGMPSSSWQYFFSQNYMFIRSGGGNSSVTLYVTSPLTANGPNRFYVNVTNVSPGLPSNVGYAIAYANYTIQQSCSYSEPTISVLPGSGWVNSGGLVNYTVTIYNNDAPSCGYSQFTAFVTSNKPNLVTSSFNSTLNQSNITVFAQSAGGYVSFPLYVNSSATFSGVSSINVTVVQSGKSVPQSASQPVTYIATYAASPSSGCNNPNVVITPASTWQNSGVNYSYTVYVYNNDNACSSSSSEGFTLSISSLPSGWKYKFNATTLSIAQNGGIGAAKLYITSPSKGIALFTVTAKVNSETGTSNNAIYVVSSVQPTCNTLPPGLAVLPPSGWGTPGMQLNYNVEITNNDNSACGASGTINLSVSTPNGWAAGFQLSNLTATTNGGLASTILSVKSPNNALGYAKINITAVDTVSSKSSTFTLTYFVPPPCSNVNYTCIVHANGVIPGWQRNIELALLNLIPPGYIFNLNVSLISVSVYTPYLTEAIPLNGGFVISNAQAQSFRTASQIGDVTYVYTAPKLYILVFHLQIAQVTQP